MPENALVFIHKGGSTVDIPADSTTATLATPTPTDTSDYTCIGVSITAAASTSVAIGTRMFTYKAFGPHTLHLPNPNVYIGGKLYWNVSAEGKVALSATGTPETCIGILMEIINTDSIRIMFSTLQ